MKVNPLLREKYIWILRLLNAEIYELQNETKHVSSTKVNLLQTEKYMWSGCCNCEINKWLSLILVIEVSSIHYFKNI